MAARRASVVSALRDRFERAVAEGDLSVGEDPSALARYVAAVTHGMAVQAAGGASREDLRRVADMALRAVPRRTGKR